QERAWALFVILTVLALGGRLAMISLHPLEGSMVKQCIAATARSGRAMGRLPIPEDQMPPPVLISLGKVVPSAEETAENIRARSAVMRVAERTEAPLHPDQGASFVKAMRLVPLGGKTRGGKR